MPIVVAIIATMIILLIIIFYYWLATDSMPSQIKSYLLPKPVNIDVGVLPKEVKTEPLVQDNKPKENATKVIKYVFPETLPENVKSGSCFDNSIAQPYRSDAWRCTAGSTIYDPCFSSESNKNKVVCQMNPLGEDVFIINLTEPLPLSKKVEFKENWAWFLELEDGTICSPYTEKNPLINEEKAIYGCKPQVKGDLDVLIGDLINGETWKARRIVVTKDSAGTGWDTKSSEDINIKNIWQ